MALKQEWTTAFGSIGDYTLTLTLEEKSYNVTNNTSVVEWALKMKSVKYHGYSNYRTTISCIVAGVERSGYSASRAFNYPVQSQYEETLSSGTVTVEHAVNGTGTCSASAYVLVAGGGDGTSPGRAPSSGTLGGTLTLTTIPRASTLSLTTDNVFTIDADNDPIAITKANNSFQHKLKFTVGNKTMTFPTSGYITGNSYTFHPYATDWDAQFPTQVSRTGTVVLETYSGTTKIGENSYSFTMAIPSDWKPTVNLSLSQFSDNPFMSDKDFYVAGYSAIRATMTGTRSHGAAISKYVISGAFSATVTTSSLSPEAQTSGVFATSGQKTVTATITDARGRTGTATVRVTYLSYSAPTVSSLSYARGTYIGGSWTSSDDGTDLRIVFKATCALANQGNNLKTWEISAPVLQDGTNLANNGTVTEYATSIGTTTSYSVGVTVTDQFGVVATRRVTVPTVEIPFVLDMTKPAIGVGAVPQLPRRFELANNWLLVIGGGVYVPQTTDVLASALSMETGYVKAFRGSGGSYSGTVPTDAFKTGTFIVSTVGASSIVVLGISSDPTDGVALNVYTTSWSGWKRINTDRYTDFTQAVSFSAGTIGSRAQSYSWTQSQIGGVPRLMQVINSSGLANFMPICTIAGTNAYLNIYRSVSTAYSNGSITVRIWY